MAHFIAGIDSPTCKNLTTRLGHAKEGISAHVRGWESGVVVEAKVVEDKDVFYIYKDGGSNHTTERVLLAMIIGGRATVEPLKTFVTKKQDS